MIIENVSNISYHFIIYKLSQYMEIIIAFVIGFILGYIVRSVIVNLHLKQVIRVDGIKIDLGENKVRSFISITVTVLLLISGLASIVNPTFKVDIALYGLMGVILAYFLPTRKK